MTDSVVIEADGGSRGNPGTAGYGAVVFDAATRRVLREMSEPIGIETNNVAEYRGLLAGLHAAVEMGARQVAVRMDSKLVIEQMLGHWQVKHPGLRPLAGEANGLLKHFDAVTFEWIPRARNAHADRLANEAMDRADGRTPRTAKATATATAQPSWAPPSGPRTRLLLVRHGSTEHSADRRFSGHNDLPLDGAGVQQAERLAARDHGPVGAVVSSPIRRARQTADLIAAALHLEVQVDANLAELDFGVFEGLTAAEANERYPEAFAQWLSSPEFAPPQGESFAALARRVRRARDAIVAAHPDATVLVVTHVSPIKTLVRTALDAPFASVRRMYLDTASVSTVDYLADGSASLRLFNDTGHLS